MRIGTASRFAALLLASAVLASCGGGGGGGGGDDWAGVGSGGPPAGSPPALGDTPPSDPLPQEYTFRVLRQGYARVTAQMETATLDQQEYYTLWQILFPPWPPGIGAPEEAPPWVDFSTEFVVIIALGSRPTGGYTLEPISVTEEGDGVAVVYEERQPGANCVVNQSITNPILLLGVSPRTTGPVTFERQVVVVNCP